MWRNLKVCLDVFNPRSSDKTSDSMLFQPKSYQRRHIDGRRISPSGQYMKVCRFSTLWRRIIRWCALWEDLKHRSTICHMDIVL
jgi:hypothetical protein